MATKSKFWQSIEKFISHTPLGMFADGSLKEALKSAVKYYTHSGMTNDKREEMSEQDKYLDENREQDYEITKRGYEEMYGPEAQLKSQAAGLDAVGINRMALAGNSAPGASASTPSPSAPSASGGNGDPIAAMMSLVGGFAQVRDITASAALKKSQKENQDIVNKWEEKKQKAIYEERMANIDNLKANLPILTANAQHAEILAQWAPQLFQSQVAKNNNEAVLAIDKAAEARSQVRLNDAETAELYQKIQNHKKEIELMNNEIMKIQQECITLGTQAHLNTQLVDESVARIAKYNKQIDQIGVQIGLTQKEIDWYKYNHAHENSASGSVSALWGLFSVSGSGQGHAYGGPPE